MKTAALCLKLGTDLDGNGMLDYIEITSSEIICNGVSGEDGGWCWEL